MNRISRHTMFMRIAEVVSQRSTCYRRNVGAILVHDNNIVSIGYNGPPSKAPHCTGKNCCDPKTGCHRAIHAERNVLGRLPIDFLDVTTLDLYVTESPCPLCCDIIAESWSIRRLFYLNQYRDISGLGYLSQYVTIYRMTPSGFIIDYHTGELVDETSLT